MNSKIKNGNFYLKFFKKMLDKKCIAFLLLNKLQNGTLYTFDSYLNLIIRKKSSSDFESDLDFVSDNQQIFVQGEKLILLKFFN